MYSMYLFPFSAVHHLHTQSPSLSPVPQLALHPPRDLRFVCPCLKPPSVCLSAAACCGYCDRAPRTDLTGRNSNSQVSNPRELQPAPGIS
jgi:hypothetical protein